MWKYILNIEVQSSNKELAMQETVFCQISANYSNVAGTGMVQAGTSTTNLEL